MASNALARVKPAPSSRGAFGNDKPVVVTKEIWYSAQLRFNLSVTRLDPRNGTQKLDVIDLKLGDPGTEWFVLPDGYRMVMGRGIQSRPMYPAELEPLIEKIVNGMTPDQLTTALAPVEAAIGAYTKAHALASPNDKTDAFAKPVAPAPIPRFADAAAEPDSAQGAARRSGLAHERDLPRSGQLALHRQAATRRVRPAFLPTPKAFALSKLHGFALRDGLGRLSP